MTVVFNWQLARPERLNSFARHPLISHLCTQGPDRLLGDEPAKLLSKETPLEEKKKIIFDYYDKLVADYDKFMRPTGEKEWPAKTCRDLAIARPDKPSGSYFIDPNEVTSVLHAHTTTTHSQKCAFLLHT